MRHLDLSIRGAGCRRCVRDLTARLRDVPGVLLVTVDPTRDHVRLTGSMTAADALAALAGTTFEPALVTADHAEETHP